VLSEVVLYIVDQQINKSLKLRLQRCLWKSCKITQDDSGGNVIILRGDSIGHCGKKVHINMRLILNIFYFLISTNLMH